MDSYVVVMWCVMVCSRLVVVFLLFYRISFSSVLVLSRLYLAMWVTLVAAVHEQLALPIPSC
jgi:hypothetical protein